MKNVNKLALSFIAILVIMTISLLPVYADSFNVSATVTQSPNNQNRTATIALSYSGGATKSIEGTVNFDSNFFESVSFGNSGNWSVRHTGTRFIAQIQKIQLRVDNLQ